MDQITKLFGAAIAGALSLIAVLLLAKPLYDAFEPLAELSGISTVLIVGLILLAIAAGIFQQMTK